MIIDLRLAGIADIRSDNFSQPPAKMARLASVLRDQFMLLRTKDSRVIFVTSLISFRLSMKHHLRARGKILTNLKATNFNPSRIAFRHQ